MNPSFRKINSAGEHRSYLLYIPESYDPARATPLVFCLHGFVEEPWHVMTMSGWNRLADRFGFIAVYPRGTGFPLRWLTYGRWVRRESSDRDVQFISDLIDKLSAEFNLDQKRIYINGMSNGGGMTFLLSCRLSERIAAFGSVAGAYSVPWDLCRPTRAVPAIIFHGDADPIVPYGGGSGSLSGMVLPEIPGWVKNLAERNGCQAQPAEQPAAGRAKAITYPGGDCGADVVFYTISGGGHTWPGGRPMMKWLTGTTTRDIEATALMWKFFEAHPLP